MFCDESRTQTRDDIIMSCGPVQGRLARYPMWHNSNLVAPFLEDEVAPPKACPSIVNAKAMGEEGQKETKRNKKKYMVFCCFLVFALHLHMFFHSFCEWLLTFGHSLSSFVVILAQLDLKFFVF